MTMITPEHHNWEELLPSDVSLLPGESFLSLEHMKPSNHTKARRLSATESLMRLTGASDPEDIGRFRPSLAALSMEQDEEVPPELKLFEALFGRDSLRVAEILKDVYPLTARSTVLALAELQGVDDHHEREEEPGRIIHESRDAMSEIAIQLTANRGWGWPYYGSVDATPEFVHTLASYCKSTGDYLFLNDLYVDRAGENRQIKDSLESAVIWIETRLGANTEGLLEYQSPSEGGLENQVWKDSWDSYHHADGTMANHQKGIASIEVQVSAYDALLDAAEFYESEHLGQPARAINLRQRAEKLKATILERFWTEDKGGYFVIGTDRDENDQLRQLKIRTSNMGHVLNSRLLEGADPEIVRKREATVAQLMSPELLAAAGIRTLASDEVRYRARAYHNGSVWAWDTHHIARGLERHGYQAQADTLDQKILNTIIATNMFVEYASGDQNTISTNTYTLRIFDTIANKFNTLIQPPQQNQAWTVAAVMEIKKRLGKLSQTNARGFGRQVVSDTMVN